MGYKMSMTMIKIRKETAERLKSLKEYESQTYDEVINKIIAIKSEELSREDLLSIEAGLNDLKKGKVYSSKDVAKRLGIRD